MPKRLYKKLFVIFSVLIAIALNVYLVLTVTRLNPSAAVSSVEFFFEPETVPIPPDTNFKLMIDPNSQGISFIRVNLLFDPSLVKLTSDITVNESLFALVNTPTSASDANSSGSIEIALMLKPGLKAPTQIFEIATLPFSYTDTNTNGETHITIIDEDTQIVDTNSIELPFSVRYATINVAQAAANKGAANFAAAAAKQLAQQGKCPDDHIDTAIGCIPIYDSAAIAAFFYRWGISIAGGIALILIVYAGYMINSSSGDPRKLQAGKELLTAAVLGLLLLVFAAYILRVIGVDIIQIPGF